RVHGRRPARPQGAGRGRPGGRPRRRTPLGPRTRALAYRGARRQGRGARAVRPAARRAGPCRCGIGGNAVMPGWRTWLTLALLAAAGISGWSILNHRAPQPVRAPVDSRSDYQLFDFELVALDENGNEAFTLRAPQLARRPGD